jgi:hypothetical protein
MTDPAYSGRLELTWTNKHLRLLAHEDSSYEWVSPADYRVAEVRLLHDVTFVGEVGKKRAADNLLIQGDALNALTSLARLPEFAGEYLDKVKLVGHLLRSQPCGKHGRVDARRLRDARSTPAQGVPSLTSSFSSDRPLATPLKGRGMPIPMVSHRFEPVTDLPGSGWVLSLSRSSHHHTLDRLSHSQPTPTQRGEERKDSLAEHPAEQGRRLVSSQSIPEEQQTQGWYVSQHTDAGCEPLPPAFPHGPVFLRPQGKHWLREGLEDRGAFFFQPGMQDGIRPTENPFDMDGASRWMDQCQQCGRPVADVFLGLRGWLPFDVPTAPGRGHGLRGSRFIGIPDRSSQTLSHETLMSGYTTPNENDVFRRATHERAARHRA